MSEIKFRCSRLGDLMTKPRTKSEPLSETTKNYLLELAAENKYGIRDDLRTKQLDKGIECEQDSIDLLCKHQSTLFVKNAKNFENDWITGTPDILDSDLVWDVKTPYNWLNFIKGSVTKHYEWQLRGYMMLTGRSKSVLAYCLTDLPEHLLFDELQRQSYYRAILEGTSEYRKLEEDLRAFYTYDRIPLEKRVRLFTINRDEAKEDKLIKQVELCRTHYEQIYEEI